MVHNSVARQGLQTLAGTHLNEQLRRLLPGSSIPPNRLLCPSMRPLARFDVVMGRG